MDAVSELAKLFKERENQRGYSPMLGRVIELPDVRIRVGDKIILDRSHLTMCVSLSDTDSEGRYIHLGKDVVLLPYADGQKFIVIGVVQ